MKNKNGFIISNPFPHYVHKSFADSISPIYINSFLYKKPFYLIPFITLYSFIYNFKLIKQIDNFLLVGGSGLFLGYIIKLFFKRKVIILLNADPFFYDLQNNSSIIRKIYLNIISTLDGIICNSKMNLKFAKKYYNGKIDHIYPYIRKTILSKKYRNINKKESYIYIGRESKEKNIKLMIKYCIERKKKLFIVGKFSKKTINQNKSDFIHFTGYKNQKEIVKISENIKYGFLLSNYDSFGITPIEYSKLGVIPLISNNVGCKEILQCSEIIVKDLKIDGIKKTVKNINNIAEGKIIKKLNFNIDKIHLEQTTQIDKFKKIFNVLIVKK